jgi:hypothetical protein
MYYWDSELLEADYGVPVDIVPRLEQQQGQEGQEQQDETSSMVVIREWSKATVRCDCSEEGKGGTMCCAFLLKKSMPAQYSISGGGREGGREGGRTHFP